MADELRATTTELTLTSLADPSKSLTLPNAVVLPGVITTVIVPPALLATLGLAERQRKRSVTPAGVAEVGVHAAATATIRGRGCTVEPVAGVEGGPVLVGQLVLDQLDWVIDPATGGLAGGVQSPA